MNRNEKRRAEQRYEYDSFGNMKQYGERLNQPYTYTGREFDSETGLYYYRARYYDPQNGRFIGRDPIGFGGGVNFYAYVGNNPVNWIDPIGLWGVGVIGSASAEGGMVAGMGATGSIGGGLFCGGAKGLNLGAFASTGSFVGSPNNGPGYPDNNGGIVGGAYAGFGAGFYFTNADTVSDFAGSFNTYSINLEFLSFQFSTSNGTWIGSITFGPPGGTSISGFPTNTFTTNPTKSAVRSFPK